MEIYVLSAVILLAVFNVVVWVNFARRLDKFRRQLPPGELDEWYQTLRRIDNVELAQADLKDRFHRFQNREHMRQGREKKETETRTNAELQAEAERILGPARDPHTRDWIGAGVGDDPYSVAGDTQEIPGMSPGRVAALKAAKSRRKLS